MLYLKIMSDQNLADSDPQKNYIIVPIANGHRLAFVRDESYPKEDPHVVALIGPHAGCGTAFDNIPEEDKDMVVPLTGNAYVLSESGKTISSRGMY